MTANPSTLHSGDIHLRERYPGSARRLSEDKPHISTITSYPEMLRGKASEMREMMPIAAISAARRRRLPWVCVPMLFRGEITTVLPALQVCGISDSGYFVCPETARNVFPGKSV
jgi:hypothetical protein